MSGWKEEMTVKFRFYLSMQHMQSATLFARCSGQIEKEIKKEYDSKSSNKLRLGQLRTEHCANITASIFTAVSFLEAMINEFFADATEEHIEYPKNLDPNTKALMADMWKKGIPRTARYSILEKFDIALILARKPTFDHGKPPAQDAEIVVQLRNLLIHYEPEWMSNETTASSIANTEKKLIKGLRGKFSTTPWISNNNPFFPDKCLSYGCARWAVESSFAYSDEFYKKLGVPAPYEHIRQYLEQI